MYCLSVFMSIRKPDTQPPVVTHQCHDSMGSLSDHVGYHIAKQPLHTDLRAVCTKETPPLDTSH